MMNPQIRELYRQAHTDGFFGMAFDPEKFAQLIVRECIDICLRNATAKDLDHWQAGVCAFDIQEHFGVD